MMQTHKDTYSGAKLTGGAWITREPNRALKLT